MDDPLAEIARLRARAATDPLEEIRALRARIARIEGAALAATTPAEGDTMDDSIANRPTEPARRPDGTPRAGSMLDALGGHYAAAAVPVDPKTKALQRRAYGFHPIAQMEADAATRAKNPARWDAAQPPGLAGAGLSMYLDARDAFIKLGGTIPDPEKED